MNNNNKYFIKNFNPNICTSTKKMMDKFIDYYIRKTELLINEFKLKKNEYSILIFILLNKILNI